jgi:hypothetical protein
MKKTIAAAGLVAGLVGGGIAGLTLGSSSLAGAQTDPTPSTTVAPDGPNEDAAHEASESPEREAAEDSGQLDGQHFDHDGDHHGHHGDDANDADDDDTDAPASTDEAPTTAPAT